jgi:hypothetical protein
MSFSTRAAGVAGRSTRTRSDGPLSAESACSSHAPALSPRTSHRPSGSTMDSVRAGSGRRRRTSCSANAVAGRPSAWSTRPASTPPGRTVSSTSVVPASTATRSERRSPADACAQPSCAGTPSKRKRPWPSVVTGAGRTALPPRPRPWPAPSVTTASGTGTPFASTTRPASTRSGGASSGRRERRRVTVRVRPLPRSGSAAEENPAAWATTRPSGGAPPENAPWASVVQLRSGPSRPGCAPGTRRATVAPAMGAPPSAASTRPLSRTSGSSGTTSSGVPAGAGATSRMGLCPQAGPKGTKPSASTAASW